MFNRNSISKALEKKGWSRYKLCKEAHLAQSTLSDILNGKAKNPNTKTLQKIADALGVSVNEFFDGDSEQGIIKKYDNIPDFEDAEEAMKFILEQPSLMAYGGYSLKDMDKEELIELANDLLFALRISIERRKNK